MASVLRRLCRPGLGVGEGLGVTTGKSPDRLPGVTVEPGSGGNVTGGSVGSEDVGVGDGLVSLTSAVIAASAGERVAPWTLTVSVTCSPTVALAPIWTFTSNSTA